MLRLWGEKQQRNKKGSRGHHRLPPAVASAGASGTETQGRDEQKGIKERAQQRDKRESWEREREVTTAEGRTSVARPDVWQGVAVNPK